MYSLLWVLEALPLLAHVLPELACTTRGEAGQKASG